MSWYVKVEDVTETMETIEKRLYACGLDRAVSILRNALADRHKCVWIPEDRPTQDLSLIDYDGRVEFWPDDER